MSETLEVRAELLKLSRLLGVGEGELHYLEGIPSAELRQFRESATERLFDDGAKMLGRVGAASRLVPAGLTATIAQKAFGPLLCARSAGMVEASKAVDVARRRRTVAEIAASLDPELLNNVLTEVVGAPETFETLLGLLSEMPAAGQAKVVGLIDAAPELVGLQKELSRIRPRT